MTTTRLDRRPRELAVIKAIAELFKQAGWSVRMESRGADLFIRKGRSAYAIEVKVASEGRGDRLTPLLSQAILQARLDAARRNGDVTPLAIVAAPRIGRSVAEQLKAFARSVAPDTAIGIVASDGFRDFVGPGLEGLATPSYEPVADKTSRPVVDLFSDLNQWLLKVVLAPLLPKPGLVNASAAQYRSASELARAARVSTMTAFRFVRQLSAEGFLKESSRKVKIVRLDDLLHRWQAAMQRPQSELAARWILRGNDSTQLKRALALFPERACLGLFAAADALGFGFVHGVPSHIYIPSLQPATLSEMGMVQIGSGVPELILRIPLTPESTFRGAVTTAARVRVADIFQVWLDVSRHPARGKEQAKVIFNRVLAPMMKKNVAD